MLYTYNLSVATNPNTKDQKRPSGGAIAVEVIDIVLDNTHPDFEIVGRERGIGAIKYYSLLEKKRSNNFSIAFPISSAFISYPKIGEVVFVERGPDYLESNDLQPSSRMYYSPAVSIWNTPEDNSIQGLKQKYSVLKGFSGDTLIQGRGRNSIRLSEDSKVVFSNNRYSSGSLESEDFTKDGSSLVMSKNKLDFDSYSKDLISKEPSTEYLKDHFLINSGKVLINSEEDAVAITSTKEFVAISKSTHIQSREYGVIDAPKIYLGKSSMGESNPIIKGSDFVEWATALLNNLDVISNAFSTAKDPTTAVTALNTAGAFLKSSLPSLKSNLKTILSKKSFVE